MNFLSGVLWTLRSLFENEDSIGEDMYFQQLQNEYPDYDISQLRANGKFTKAYSVESPVTGSHYLQGNMDDIDLALQNQQLVDMAATGLIQLTDIDFENGCLYEGIDPGSVDLTGW